MRTASSSLREPKTDIAATQSYRDLERATRLCGSRRLIEGYSSRRCAHFPDWHYCGASARSFLQRTGPKAIQATQNRTDVPVTIWLRRREQVSRVTERDSPLPDAKLLVQKGATSPRALIPVPDTVAAPLSAPLSTSVCAGRRPDSERRLCAFGPLRIGSKFFCVDQCDIGTADDCPGGHSTFAINEGVAA